jgi:poly(3-hydroxybutyrate) depolymerase
MYRFFREITNIKSPTWATPNTIVFTRPAFHLRFFQAGHHTTLILPPAAGHSSCISDYKKDQSLVEHYCNKGHTVYAMDWRSCTFTRRSESINDLVEQVREAIVHIGTEVHLVGLCQAGWLATMFTAEYPEMVESLTIGGAPIDFGEDSYIKRLVKHTPQEFYQWLVFVNGGLMPGYLILWGFKNMHCWERYIGDYMKLWQSLDNSQELDRLRHFRNWYETTQSLAGRWYLEAVDWLFRKNLLIKGSLGFDLKRIKCPVKMIAGKMDDITPPPQVYNLEKYVSSKQIEKELVSAGHIGLFVKSTALRSW